VNIGRIAFDSCYIDAKHRMNKIESPRKVDRIRKHIFVRRCFDGVIRRLSQTYRLQSSRSRSMA